MVLHVGLLVGALLEVGLGARPFVPALGWPMLVLVMLAVRIGAENSALRGLATGQ